MATYTRVSGDYNIVSIDPTVDNVNVTTSSLNVTGNLNVAGNITYITVESFTVDDPFITIAGNNSGTLGTAPYQEQGIVARTSNSTYAGIRFDNGTQEWQISSDVFANGTPDTAYVAISTYTDADVAAYLPTYTGNISAGNVSVTGNISAGNLDAVNLVINSISSDDSTFVTIEDGLNVNGEISATGNITAGNISVTNGTFTNLAGTLTTAAQTNITSVGMLTSLSVTGNISAGNLDAINLVINSISSDDSTFVTIEDGLNVNGEISATGDVSVGGNLNVTGNISATGSILAVPAWTSAGAITLTATTTNPTKGTTTSDNISYRQLGAKQWEVVLTYIQTVADGVNGSGDYLFTLPNGLSFDATLPSQQIYTTNIGTNTYALMSYIIPSGSGLINNDSLGGQVYPIVYDATKFRILTTTWGSAIQCWGSGYYSLGGDDPKIQLTFRFTST